MRKIAMINFKGGTGKTTTVVNLGAGLAMRGKKVLLVDVDAQGSLAISLGLSFDKSLTNLLIDKCGALGCLIPARPNMDIIPSDNSLLLAQRALAREANWQSVLAEALEPVEPYYDFAILDCAASVTPLNINALTYATEICIPTQVEYLSLMGLNQVLENLARIRFPNEPRYAVGDLGITLMIPTMYDGRKRTARRLAQELRDTYGQHVAPPIRVNVRLSEAPSYHKTIFEYAPTSPGAADYNRLVDIILQESLLAEEKPIGLQQRFQPSVGPEDGELVAEDILPVEEEPAAILAPIQVLLAPVEAPSATVEAPPAPAEAPAVVAPPPAPAQAPLAPAEAPAVVAPPPAPAATPPAEHLPAPPSLEKLATVGAPECPTCGNPLHAINVAGYRVYHCEHCGYQKQVLVRDLRVK